MDLRIILERNSIAIKTAIVQGVENGCSVVRQANMGHTSERKTMVSEIPTKGRFTIYPYIGNVLPWYCAAYIVLFLLNNIRRYRKSGTSIKGPFFH
ncbi:hypothetical protein [Anaerocolumna xylanovorans]|uniref:hypothetical protein n=1 Tax=Anaerocolumna xylanovorans TaxID=100134 RepID=UPI000936BAE9|nr:hypothetical protein [Anaerocolumna xylanovorans]